MSLITALVARGDVILAEKSLGGGGAYDRMVQQILSKIPPNDSKLTYAANDILIHYQKANDIVALVVAEDSAGRRMPFAFLNELYTAFTHAYTAADIAAATELELGSYGDTIEKLMRKYMEAPPQDPLKGAHDELSNVKGILVQNVEQVLKRGERLDLLIDKTDNMTNQARAFRKRAVVMRRTMWWRNIKLTALIALTSVLILYMLLASMCGPGLHCFS